MERPQGSVTFKTSSGAPKTFDRSNLVELLSYCASGHSYKADFQILKEFIDFSLKRQQHLLGLVGDPCCKKIDVD